MGMVYGIPRPDAHPHHLPGTMERGRNLRLALGGAVGRTQDKRNYGRIWPNGNFSVGLGPVGSEALEMSESDGSNLAAWGDHPGLPEAVAALNSSNAPNSHTSQSDRPQRGLNGISSHGQQMLRSACYLLERDYGNADLCFATLTVPQLSRLGRQNLAGSWSELVRQFQQWVTRKLIAAGRPTKVVGCTEVQSGRLERSGEGYLHLHAVWPSHSNSAGQLWAVRWADLRGWWERALIRFSGEELPHHPRVEVAPVRKSAERYMGKYLSKGSGEMLESFVSDLGPESVPPTWWFMTADMRHQVKDETVRGPSTGEVLYSVIQTALDDGDLSPFEWIKPVMVTLTDRPIHLGWCGRLRPGVRADLADLLAPLTAMIIPELS